MIQFIDSGLKTSFYSVLFCGGKKRKKLTAQEAWKKSAFLYSFKIFTYFQNILVNYTNYVDN